MPADSNRGACWSCWSFKSNAPMPRLWYCSLLCISSTKIGALDLKKPTHCEVEGGGCRELDFLRQKSWTLRARSRPGF